MPKVLSIKNYCSENLGGVSGRTFRRPSLNCSIFEIATRRKARSRSFDRNSFKVGMTGIGLLLVITTVLCGALYLYQVNDLATKGYEVRDIEKKIEDLKKENEQFRIREVELKSMYNIEKATENLDLVGSTDISYLEINGPVAMK